MIIVLLLLLLFCVLEETHTGRSALQRGNGGRLGDSQRSGPGEDKSSLDVVFPCMVPLVVERSWPESQAYILLLWKNQEEGMSSEGLAAGFGMKQQLLVLSPKPCCCCHGKVCSEGLKEVEIPLFDTPPSFLTPLRRLSFSIELEGEPEVPVHDRLAPCVEPVGRQDIVTAGTCSRGGCSAHGYR